MKNNTLNENNVLIGKFDVKRIVVIIIAATAISLFANWLSTNSLSKVPEKTLATDAHTQPMVKPAHEPAPEKLQDTNTTTSDAQALSISKEELADTTPPVTKAPANIGGTSSSVYIPHLNNTYQDGRTMNPYALQEHFGTRDMAAPDPDAQKTYNEGHEKLKASMQQFQRTTR